MGARAPAEAPERLVPAASERDVMALLAELGRRASRGANLA